MRSRGNKIPGASFFFPRRLSPKGMCVIFNWRVAAAVAGRPANNNKKKRERRWRQVCCVCCTWGFISLASAWAATGEFGQQAPPRGDFQRLSAAFSWCSRPKEKEEEEEGGLVTFSPARLDRCENARVTLYAPSSSITNNGLPHLYVYIQNVCVCVLWRRVRAAVRDIYIYTPITTFRSLRV